MENKTTQENTAVSRAKVLSGIVVSDKMKDTVVVQVERYLKHPKYQKFMNIRKRYKVHNPGNTKKTGDKVEIISCRPISRHKSFKIVNE